MHIRSVTQTWSCLYFAKRCIVFHTRIHIHTHTHTHTHRSHPKSIISIEFKSSITTINLSINNFLIGTCSQSVTKSQVWQPTDLCSNVPSRKTRTRVEPTPFCRSSNKKSCRMYTIWLVDIFLKQSATMSYDTPMY